MMVPLVILAILGLLHHKTVVADSSDIGLDPAQMIRNHGYICEVHNITTEDGYILTYHRIPSRNINDTNTIKKPTVLILHGMFASSADYVAMGPGRSLGFVLADLGYDVWLGNSRGNAFSRNHTSLDPVKDAEQFYNFSFHEMGYYDLASAIDYILDLKEDDSLYYIAHSQGGTAFLVLTSTRPEYNSKIKIASLMAPAAFLKHYPSMFVQSLCKYIHQLERLMKKLQVFEVPLVKGIRNIISTQCKDPSSSSLLCDIAYNVIASDGNQIEREFLPVISTNAPSNSGVRPLIHYGQLVAAGGFSQFDYGPEKNMQIYGTENPPPYNLSKITTPVAFYYARNDEVIAMEDEQVLISMIQNVANDYLVPYELFRHNYFTFAKDVVKLVYNELISVMKKY